MEGVDGSPGRHVALALVMPLSAVIGLTLSAAFGLSIMCLVAFAHMGWKTCLMTVNNDIYPSAVAGSVSGIIAFGSSFGAVLFTILTGHLFQRCSYTIVFVLMGFLHPTAYLVFRLVVKGPVTLRQAIHADETS